MSMQPLFLHIGAPKTGTTYLQSLMREQRRQLRNIGVLVPGPGGKQKKGSRDFVRNGSDPGVGGGHWWQLVEEVRGWDGPAVISNETFGARLGKGHLARLTEDFADRELHVIFTVRDLQRQLPAAWQEAVKNGSALSFAEYVDCVSASDPDEKHVKARRIWWAQDAPSILAKWSDVVPSDHIHVVTVPPRGAPPDLLWRRFASVLGIEPTEVDAQAVRPNTSLGNVETNVLRRVNQVLMSDTGMSAGDYIRFVKTPVANGVLQFPGARGPIHLTTDQARWAAAESVRIADELSTLAYRVVGDLDEMRPPAVAPDDDYQDPDQPRPEDERDAAVATLAGLIIRTARSRESGGEPDE
jgi:hypothetical protein